MREDSVLDDGSYDIALLGEIDGVFLDYDVIRPWSLYVISAEYTGLVLRSK